MKLNGKSRTTEANGFPGPRNREMIEEFTHYVAMTPQPFVLDRARCEGMWLATVDGQRIFEKGGLSRDFRLPNAGFEIENRNSKINNLFHRRLREPEYLEQLAMAANNKIANPDFLTDICLSVRSP